MLFGRPLILMLLFVFQGGKASDIDHVISDIVRESVKQVEAKQSEAISFINGQVALNNPILSPKKSCSLSRSPKESPPDEKIIFLVFVSFSMPDASLVAIYNQMSQVGGRLVTRGLLNNSFQETQKKLRDIGIELEIDPTLFERYTIDQVPTYVLEEKRSGRFDQISGNVDPLFVLNLFKEQGEIGKGAKLFRMKLEAFP